MRDAMGAYESRTRGTRHISMGDLIAAIYDLAIQEINDPELAMIATDATLSDILSRSQEARMEGRVLQIEPAR